MSASRAVGTCKHCHYLIIYRHWNGHRAWTHRYSGNVNCSPWEVRRVAEPEESGKFENGEEPK